MKQKQFGYPCFDEKGEEILTTYDNEYSQMMMDIRVYRLKENEERIFCRQGEETAILLLSGKISYVHDGKAEEAGRQDVFTDGPFALHVCTGTEVKVTAHSDAEILVQCARNQQKFASRFYRPEDAPWGYSCAGKYGDVAKRRVNTIFDHETAPYSNMVLGEVLNDRGNWSGFIPHRHPQPEVYFYRFDSPQGFGAGYANGEIFKTTHNGMAPITSGFHSQTAAPGYAMCYSWGIRHLDGDPWMKTRIDDKEHEWLWKSDANEHIYPNK